MRGIAGKPPLARREHRVIEELADETLVYDLERDRAHCLNRSSALAWKYSDGKTGVGEMAEQIERDLATPITNQAVRYAPDRLGKAHPLDVRSTPLPAGVDKTKADEESRPCGSGNECPPGRVHRCTDCGTSAELDFPGPM
jgi:hypothetical protein